MKRVVKKTIATVLSSAMMFGTMLSGGVTPVFANVIASDTSDITFDVLADTQYDDGRVTVMTDQELVVEITSVCKELGIVL